MRRFSIPVALTVLLVSAVALADNDKVVSQFEALAASGISAQARVNRTGCCGAPGRPAVAVNWVRAKEV